MNTEPNAAPVDGMVITLGEMSEDSRFTFCSECRCLKQIVKGGGGMVLFDGSRTCRASLEVLSRNEVIERLTVG